MKINKNMKWFAAVPVVLVAACGSSPPQTVTGHVAATTFPYPVDTVRAVRAGRSVVAAPVAADGSFAIEIPSGSRYRLEFAAADGRSGLVFPRQLGTIDVTFDVRGHQAPFDLGAVRYLGDPATHTYKTTTGGGTEDGDGECENGVDPSSGAVCVDDEDASGTCEGQDEGDCEDGIDPATGAECDGGPAANQDDGSEPDGEDPSDDAPAAGAVADRNLPAAIGCDEEDDGESNDD